MDNFDEILSNDDLDPKFLKVLKDAGFTMERQVINGEFNLFSDVPLKDKPDHFQSIVVVYPPHDEKGWSVQDKQGDWVYTNDPEELKAFIKARYCKQKLKGL